MWTELFGRVAKLSYITERAAASLLSLLAAGFRNQLAIILTLGDREIG